MSCRRLGEEAAEACFSQFDDNDKGLEGLYVRVWYAHGVSVCGVK